MLPIVKKLVTNEAMQPIAVQIDYVDWLKIEPLLYQHTQRSIKRTHDTTVWQNQWCELAQKIDQAWKSDKSNA
ncbi:MAG: hypothetical protein DRR08_03985 [Candidatus Parabeggiatoa sp. nov. 2]|nr:MAG: hypothetical protein DRR08_03985 [Gammaproteobacteria bacterium]